MSQRRRGATANELNSRKIYRCKGSTTTIKYLRRTTTGAAGNGLEATIKYLKHTTSGAAGNGLELQTITCAAPRASAWAP